MDPREDALLKLAYSSAWVRPFKGFIFVCGGPVDVRQAEPLSVRDALLRRIGSKKGISERIRLAEEFKDWAYDGHYRDLLSFEEHLAELSDVIVLILESPGTLAELGLFTALEAIREKLSVYISKFHFEQDSFIRLGPIKLLELSNNEAAVFPWTNSGADGSRLDQKWLNESSQELLDELEDKIATSAPEVRFDGSRWLHKVLLICNLLWLMHALKLSEIEEYLDLFGAKMLPDELKQAMFMLDKIGLVAIAARGRDRFYIANDKSDFIRWGVRPTDLDLHRIQMEVARHYETSDKKRFRALQEARR